MDSKANSRHLTKLIIAEFGYCFAFFLIFTFAKTNVSIAAKVYMAMVCLVLVIVAPVIFNAVKYFKHRKKAEYGKAGNYLIVQVLLLVFYGFLLR